MPRQKFSQRRITRKQAVVYTLACEKLFWYDIPCLRILMTLSHPVQRLANCSLLIKWGRFSFLFAMLCHVMIYLHLGSSMNPSHKAQELWSMYYFFSRADKTYTEKVNVGILVRNMSRYDIPICEVSRISPTRLESYGPDRNFSLGKLTHNRSKRELSFLIVTDCLNMIYPSIPLDSRVMIRRKWIGARKRESINMVNTL